MKSIYKNQLIGVIFIVTLTLMMGCYTVLRHSKVYDPNFGNEFDETHFYQVTHLDDCSQCHIKYHSYHDTYFSAYPYFPPNDYKWQFYYESPWWVDEYYMPNTDKLSEEVPQPRNFSRQGQQVDGQTAAPVVTPVYPSGPGHIAKKAPDTDKSNTSRNDSTSNKPRKRVIKESPRVGPEKIRKDTTPSTKKNKPKKKIKEN